MGSIVCENQGCRNEAMYETEFGDLICIKCAEKMVDDDKCDWEALEEI